MKFNLQLNHFCFAHLHKQKTHFKVQIKSLFDGFDFFLS